MRWMYLLLSFVLVAFGEPAWTSFLGFFAASIGWALFWYALVDNPKRVILSFLFFALVASVQLSWLTSTVYQGYAILGVYLLVISILGLQFALFTFFVPQRKALSLIRMLALAGLWVLLEWSRLFWLSGFSWNPLGMALASHQSSLQMASLFGVYGLSFWVVFTNLLAYRFLVFEKTKRAVFYWMLATLFPYGFGLGQQLWVTHNSPSSEKLSVVLVQTALLPEEKEPFFSQEDKFVPPLDQWMRIVSYLQNTIQNQKVDLIVLPETTVPFRALSPIYPMDYLERLFLLTLGKKSLLSFPNIRLPLVKNTAEGLMGTNLYIAQALSNYFHAELVIGLDDYDLKTGKNFNAAFYIKPGKPMFHRYEKRVLVPVAEYLPFSWCSSIASRYGISGTFTAGEKAKLFGQKVPFSPSICYEETFGDYMREGRVLGARLFVNITNDVWFPFSRLAREHFEHGRVRAVENGVPVIRACNTGVTGAIDCFGRVIATLGSSRESQEMVPGALHVMVPIRTFKTLYSLIGDVGIISLSGAFLVVALVQWAYLRYRKKLVKEAS